MRGSHSLKEVIAIRAIVLAAEHAAAFETEDRTAWARVIPAKLLKEFLATSDDSVAALDLGLGRESLAALARYLKTSAG